jgi:hypothetical protein
LAQASVVGIEKLTASARPEAKPVDRNAASAADLKSLLNDRRVRRRSSKSISGTRILLEGGSMTSRNSRKGVAEADRELRKLGASREEGVTAFLRGESLNS